MKITKIALFTPLLVILIPIAILFWWQNAKSASNPSDKQKRDFLITKGQSVESISKKLEKEGFIKNALAFKLYVQLTNKEKKIQAGEYKLSPDLIIEQIVETLSKGPEELWITYQEGLRREEMAAKTIKTLNLNQEQSQTFWNEFMQESEDKEGFLFPETYLFPKEIPAKKVVAKLLSTFDSKVTNQMLNEGKKNTNLSKKEIITLASILERETKTNEERPVVAGILLKRLKANWPLQADASLQYIIGNKRCAKAPSPILDCEWWKPPTAEDKTQKSPYNTYLLPGLPPAPIANPGLSPIKAVVNPQGSPYWYYLHDDEGKIHYAKTMEEHQANISKYLRFSSKAK